jgi:hypothetical protein
MELSRKTVVGDFAHHKICNTTRTASPNDRSFPTRASFYDKRGSVGVPSGRRINYNNCCAMRVASEDGYLSMPTRTIRSLPLSLSSPRIIMSSVSSTSTSHTNFSSIFNAALESYRRKTKRDLASHPLLPSLQHCDSTEAILSVLREQIPAFNHSQNSDDELSKWVIPTVNVLNAFSDTLGQVVGLVNISTLRFGRISILMFTFQAFPPADIIFAGIGILLTVSCSYGSLEQSILTLRAPRRPKMPARIKTSSLMFSTASNVSFSGLTNTLASHRLQL